MNAKSKSACHTRQPLPDLFSAGKKYFFLVWLVVFSLGVGFPSTSSADTTGEYGAGLAVVNTAVGAINWQQTANIVSSNDAWTWANITQNTSTYYLVVTNFGFWDIPADATIEGIEVKIERHASYDTATRYIYDNQVRLVKDDGGGGYVICTVENKAKDSSVHWPLTTDGIETYGSSSDLWGETWTPADINSKDKFGVAIAAQGSSWGGGPTGLYVDHVTISVTYSTNKVTVGNGTDPGNATVGPGTAITDLDAFTLQTVSGTATVTGVTATLSSITGVQTVAITNSAGDTVYGSATPSSTTVAISPLDTNIGVTSTETTYKVRITPKAHADMPAVPGGSYPITGTVTSITDSLGGPVYNDSGSATITIDNASPSDVTGFGGADGFDQVPLSWTNPGDADFSEVIVLRKIGSAVDDSLVEGTTYLVNDVLANGSKVIYAGSGASHTDTDGVVYGTNYYYKIFAKDSRGNYSSSGVAAGPYTSTNNYATVAGTATAVAREFELGVYEDCSDIDVSMSWTEDGNSNNVLTVEYKLTTDGSYTEHSSGHQAANPYTTTIPGLTPGADYDVRLTYADTDGVNGTSVVNVEVHMPVNPTSAVGVPTVTDKDWDWISVAVSYTDDFNENNSATVKYREVGGSWSGDTALTRNASSFTGTISGLTELTSYEISITVTDSDYISGTDPLSTTLTQNIFSSTIAHDWGAPETITLSVHATDINSNYRLLYWTAPYDDASYEGGGPGPVGSSATTYDIRYATKEIVESGPGATQIAWADATQATGEPSPAVAGTTEYFYVTGLDANTTYYFAIKAGDEKDPVQWSAISNIPSGKTGLMYGWNMVSCPRVLGATNSTNAVFGDDAGIDWMFNWIPTSHVDPETSGDWSQLTTVEHAKGMLVWAEDTNLPTDAPGDSTEYVAATKVLTLLPGFNLIGNPYETTVNLTDCAVSGHANYDDAVSGNTLSNALYTWGGSSYTTLPYGSATLEPWKTYWLLNKTGASVELTINNPTP